MGHSVPNASTHDTVGAEYRKDIGGGSSQQPAVWATNSDSPEAKIPKGQFVPGSSFQPPKNPINYKDPVPPGSPLV